MRRLSRPVRALYALLLVIPVMWGSGCVSGILDFALFPFPQEGTSIPVGYQLRVAYFGAFCDEATALRQVRISARREDGATIAGAIFPGLLELPTTSLPEGTSLVEVEANPIFDFFGRGPEIRTFAATVTRDLEDPSGTNPAKSGEQTPIAPPWCDTCPASDLDPGAPGPMVHSGLGTTPKRGGPRDTIGDPIHLPSGALTETVWDTSYISPGHPFQAIRNYRSTHANRDGPFGPGWSWSYGWTLTGDQSTSLQFVRGPSNEPVKIPVTLTSITETDSLGAERQFNFTAPGVTLNGPTTCSVCEVAVTCPGGADSCASTLADVEMRDRGGFRRVYTGNRLTALVDLKGNTTQIVYDTPTAATPSSIVDSAGRVIVFGSADGRITSMTIPNGDTWTYEYTGGYLTAVVDPRGGTTRYTYDPGTGWLTSKAWPNGEVRSWTYDTLGRVTGWTNEAGEDATIAYLENPARTVVTDAAGGVWTYEIEDGVVVRTTRPDSAVLVSEYNAANQLTATVDAEGRRTEYEYDEQGFLIRREEPGGLVHVFVRDENGRVTERIYPDSSRMLVSFDADGHPLTVTNEENETVRYAYNPAGQPVAVTDPTSRTTQIAYDAEGNPVAVTDPLFHRTEMSYDAISRPIEIRDPLLRVTQLEYHLGSLVSRVVRPDLSESTVEYDLALNPVREVDPAGNVATATWVRPNAESLPATVTDGAGNTARFEYDAEGRRVAVVSPRGARTSLTRDLVGRVVAIQDPEGGVSQIVYNPDDTVQMVVDPVQEETSFVYDPRLRLTETHAPDGGITRREYDDRDRLVRVTNPEEETREFEYDAAGRLVRDLDGLGNPRTREYDDRGLLTRHSDRRGNDSFLRYDDAGRLVEAENPLGEITRFAYDAASQLVSLTDGENRTVEFEYDLLGRRVKVLDPEDRETVVAYTANDLVASVTDPLNRTVRNFYDPARRLTRTEDALGHSTSYTYDADSNLVLVSDARSHTTSFVHDLRGLVTATTDHLGRSVSSQYDPAGRLVKTVNSRGQEVAYGYDAVGRLVTKARPSGEGVDQYVYDLAGRRTLSANGHGLEGIQYDAAGRPLGKIDLLRNFVADLSLDADGNVLTRTDSQGRTYERIHDELGRVTEIRRELASYTFSYNAANQVTTRTYPNGDVTSFGYDLSGRLARVEHRGGVDGEVDPTGEILVAFDYEYDDASNRTAETVTRGTDTPVRTEYEYNARNELVRALVVTPGGEALRGWGEIRYSYDEAGNRTSRVVDGVAEAHVVNELDQVVTRIGLAYSYDEDGNLIREELAPGVARQYSYDAENRLTETRLERSLGGGHTVDTLRKFRYSADGFRIRSIAEEVEASGETIQERFWMGGRVLEDYAYQGPEGQTPVDADQASYVHAGLGVLERIGLSITGGVQGTPSSAFFYHDSAGSVIGTRATGDGSGNPGEVPPIERVSLGANGEQFASSFRNPGISGDGRYVIFSTFRAMVPEDTNGIVEDWYLKDRQTGAVELISKGTNGESGVDNIVGRAQISSDGQVVAFASRGWNIVPGGTGLGNLIPVIFVRDRRTGTTERISEKGGGQHPGANPAISADGRFVAFETTRSILPEDTSGNTINQVYIRDRVTGAMELVSKNAAGVVGNNVAQRASVSEDGRYVAFQSDASNLLATPDTNGRRDIFVKDRLTGEVSRVNVSSAGAQANSSSENATVSPTGRWVTFQSVASNLAPGGDTTPDIYLHDRDTGVTTQVSNNTASSGELSFGETSISRDGRFVVYIANDASAEVPGDSNGAFDVFLEFRDNLAQQTYRISVGTNETQADSGSGGPKISSDGRWIAFHSDASNLVDGDTNGARDVFVAANPAIVGAGAGDGEFRWVGYTPFGERRADTDVEVPFGFQGLRTEDLGGDQPHWGAWYRDANPTTGRWTNRDPGGFIDGPNRYRALRNNPLRFIDPDGRNPVAALIAWLGTLTLEQQATFGALSLASLYFVGQQATTAPSGPFTIPDLPPITGPFQPPVHEAPVGPYSPPTIGPAVGPYIPPSYESPVGSFTVPQGLGFTCLFQTDVEQAAEIMKGLGHLLEIDDACVHCAKVLEQELEARGIDAQVIDLNAVTFVPDVYDVKTGKRVSTGRLHRGVRVGDTVFDNAYPEGLPYNEWVNRFISGGRPLRPTPK